MVKTSSDTDTPMVGSALVSNTTLCEAGRVLGWEHRDHSTLAPVVALRILDLLSIIDASVLYDRLFTVPGKISSDADSLTLRSALIGSGTVKQLPTAKSRDLAARALSGMLSTEKKLGRMSQSSVRELQLAASRFLAKGSGELANETSDRGFNGAELGVDSFSELAGRVMGSISSGATSRYIDRDPTRALCYELIAEELALPFWPSAYYRPMLAEFPNYFSRSARTAIYERLSSILETTVYELAAEFDGTALFVPPFSAIVLNRASRPENIPGAVLDLRQEYGRFRQRMADLETERAAAKSIAARLKMRTHIEALCRDVCQPFDSPTPMRMKGSLKYIPDLVELAAAPTNPAAWTRVLLEKPAEWLMTWYRRRPVIKLVGTAREVATLSSYNDLLQKHFGGESTAALRNSRRLIKSVATAGG